VKAPPNAEFTLTEGRTSGTGAAPDVVKVYLSEREAASDGKMVILEGEDLGKICYKWRDPTTVQISISDGYVDRVRADTKIGNKVFHLQYVGPSPSCQWKHGDPA